ncbi:YczE/YyaS/YitT family protein [Virgibacillus salexigens]|uniref:YczE/YyaS/YitT family protein n=1 Tax=Virgibacillus salexigens TaxID=61016 RepID=UPI003F82BB69
MLIIALRWLVFFLGLMLFSLGISISIQVQYLGIHPWDVLNVALYEKFGLSIGSWAILISILLIIISWFLDKRYIKLGTFLNAVLIGAFVDFYLFLDFLPKATHSWIDYLIIIIGIVIMGLGGGIYNAAGVGSGPRDGFMLSISDKTSTSVGKVRIITESIVLVIGFMLGGPVFLFTFLFTFIQSPIFQYTYERLKKWIRKLDELYRHKQISKMRA